MQLTEPSRLPELLETLVDTPEAPSVSLYMPTHVGGAGADEDPIHLKNLLKEAVGKLRRAGLENKPTMRGMLTPLQALVNDHALWRGTSGGLALFASPTLARGLLSPHHFAPLCVLSTRFHTRPLLALRRETAPFFVLALSPKASRLLRCTCLSTERVDVPLMPSSLATALPFDDPESQLQFHTYTQAANRGAVFHGHTPADDSRRRSRRYLILVRDAVANALAGEQAPLVTAMAEPLMALYRELNRYPHLLDEAILTSPDRLTDEELKRKAWERVEPVLRAREEHEVEALMRNAASERMITDIEKIVPLAAQGRVDSVIIDRDSSPWGWVDAQKRVRAVGRRAGAPGCSDLLDRAAQSTMRYHGHVYEVPSDQLPGDESIAAILRY